MEKSEDKIFWIGNVRVELTDLGPKITGENIKELEKVGLYLLREGFKDEDKNILINKV